MMEHITCENCAFFARYPGSPLDGTCRRHAPPAVSIEQHTFQPVAEWPNVGFDDWCGEGMKDVTK